MRRRDGDRPPMIATAGGFAGLIAALDGLDVLTAPAAHIAMLLRACDVADAELRTDDDPAPERYTRHPVVRNERFEVLVLRWPAGSASPIHDHGGSRCFVKVLRGALEVTDYALLSGGRAPGPAHVARLESTCLERGALDVRSAERDIHRVRPVTETAAVSLHVYAAPLDRCMIFDPASRTCRAATPAYEAPLSVERR